MDLIDITQCKKDFDFKPLTIQKDSLPSIAWNGYLLTGFHRTHGTVLNLLMPLPQLLRDCYPNLSFVELVRFLDRLYENELLFSEFKVDILAAYHYKDHPELDDMLGLVISLPFNIQNYLAEKALALKELYPLRLAVRHKPESAREFISKTLGVLVEKRATRAQIAKAITLATELFLMGKEPFLDGARTVEIWLRYLEQTRFPNAKSYDMKQEEKLKKLPWPSHVQARWIRDGDSTGIEVKFNIHNPTELEKLIEGLENLSPHLEDDLWKNH
jgi:hypothetical protein